MTLVSRSGQLEVEAVKCGVSTYLQDDPKVHVRVAEGVLGKHGVEPGPHRPNVEELQRAQSSSRQWSQTKSSVSGKRGAMEKQQT